MHADKPAGLKSRRKKILSVAAAMAGCLVAVCLLIGLSGRRRPEPFPSRDWARRTVAGVSLEAPFDFTPGPAIPFSEETQAVIQQFEIRWNANSNDHARTSVAMIHYVDQVKIDLDGAVERAIRNGAAGDSTTDQSLVKLESTEVRIGGLPARRARGEGPSKEDKRVVEAVFIQDGQRLLAVTVVYQSAAHQPSVTRLLDSVQIAK